MATKRAHRWRKAPPTCASAAWSPWHAVSRLGGRGLAADVRRAAPVQNCLAMHVVHDPSAFLEYDAIRKMIWHMLVGLPALRRRRDIDLSPSNWVVFRPDTVATSILEIVRGNDSRGLCGGHYHFTVAMDMKVTLVFNEPKALLSYCTHEKLKYTDR
ncbi:hypothetical protein BS78_02G173700 [Paspalum vaginatum]|nr:hypothetical protein BS78_02G173700 [Paspalum vaginatum]